jgi:hypothetical protein
VKVFSYGYERNKCLGICNCLILGPFLNEGNFLHSDLLCPAKNDK